MRPSHFVKYPAIAFFQYFATTLTALCKVRPFLLIVCVTLAVWKKPMSFKYLAYTSSFLLNKFEITLRLQTTSCFLNFLFVRKIKLTYLFARLPMKTKYPFSSHWRIYVLALNLSTKPFAACHLRGYSRNNV